MANEKITIKMVSEKAKVSKTTVSRYLNGKYEFMSAKTRKTIEEVIEELNYRPNIMAQGLKSNKTGLIGLVIADMINPFSSRLIKGVSDVCTSKAFQIIIIDTNNDSKKERDSIQSLVHLNVEGIIISTTGKNNEFIRELRKQGIKLVLAGEDLDESVVDTVTVDDEKAISEMIRKVYDEGFERVGFFSQTLSSELRKKKHIHFLETVAIFSENTTRGTYIIDENFPISKECDELLKEFLSTYKGDKLAVFSENSFVLINIINAIYRLGLRIPEDIGVCGYDELDLTHVIADGISVISKPTYQIGSEAAELLVKRITKGKEQYKSKYIELPSIINVNKSTLITNNNFDKIVVKFHQHNKHW